MSVCKSIDISTANGKLTEGIKVAVAAFYSRNLSIKVKRGKKENLLQKNHNGGISPLGYDIAPDGTYVINEYEAIAVKKIFSMKIEGAGYGKIVDWLKANGYKTKRGGDYSKGAIHDILRNRKYIGVLELGKSTKHNSRKKADNYMEFEDALPAIIEKKDFLTVEKIMARCRNGATNAPCGNTALNLLGISTQVTAVWSYISDGPYKTYEWNSTKLEFKHRTNKEITGLSYMTSLVIQALKTLGKSNVTPDIIQTLSEKLSDDEKQACLKEATEATDWVYDTIRKMCGGGTQ